MKYLTLIRAIALLHQHQRPVKTRARRRLRRSRRREDIDVADRLMAEVLGRSLDELPPQTRKLLLLIDELVHGECGRAEERRFSLQPPRRARVHRLGQDAAEASICTAWRSWNICSCITAGAARASCTNFDLGATPESAGGPDRRAP